MLLTFNKKNCRVTMVVRGERGVGEIKSWQSSMSVL